MTALRWITIALVALGGGYWIATGAGGEIAQVCVLMAAILTGFLLWSRRS